MIKRQPKFLILLLLFTVFITFNVKHVTMDEETTLDPESTPSGELKTEKCGIVLKFVTGMVKHCGTFPHCTTLKNIIESIDDTNICDPENDFFSENLSKLRKCFINSVNDCAKTVIETIKSRYDQFMEETTPSP